VPLRAEHRQALFDKFTTVIRATVKGNLVVAVLQGALGGFIFWLLGIRAPVVGTPPSTSRGASHAQPGHEGLVAPESRPVQLAERVARRRPVQHLAHRLPVQRARRVHLGRGLGQPPGAGGAVPPVGSRQVDASVSGPVAKKSSSACAGKWPSHQLCTI
jgi:hypothetical protein